MKDLDQINTTVKKTLLFECLIFDFQISDNDSIVYMIVFLDQTLCQVFSVSSGTNIYSLPILLESNVCSSVPFGPTYFTIM